MGEYVSDQTAFSWIPRFAENESGIILRLNTTRISVLERMMFPREGVIVAEGPP
ncbi:hypothetical protein [Leptospira meyeri]|uniref:hypothetical protein n=1 Tax=Leptospira meyeri TaxID=29508 RepID=UPI001E5C6EA3|nr:hypothetical protein [Leptospira meyeri]